MDITTRELQFFGQYAKVHRPMLNEINAVLAEYRLFNSQWTILKLLFQDGDMTPAEIATKQQVEKPSVTKILQRLEELTYIEVRPGEDRREKWIRLTESGHTVCHDIMGKLDALYKVFLKGVPAENIEIATAVLTHIQENLK
ncbi:MarR family winged helix-turn-helix transcriptional regulator [Sporosarcina sp. Te-1]|uniref:MarR family winged helix-turn-helix transcriptional regulator n=1 Tax=Sporosarcina sp. Te-1 TaxID=2818390 RepID=UPI001A9F7743|nr:MarR family transcriptional regulator [Sporosarcina sp. Te-1]QTD40049.1 MarR family transcriptional regulator [Sporosarcina sp. Te-1]